ncbi:MAG TPA: hypothetical protein VH743_21675 [Beijerinckiaceae bacterium]|jgi:hypothetical protein
MDRLADFWEQLGPVRAWFASLWERLAPALSELNPWADEVIAVAGRLPVWVFVVAAIPPVLALLSRSFLGFIITLLLAGLGIVALLPISHPRHGLIMFAAAIVSAFLVLFLARRWRRKVRVLARDLAVARRESESFREQYEREVLWRTASDRAAQDGQVVTMPKVAV